MDKERKEGYKKNIVMYLIALLIMIIIYLSNFRMSQPFILLIYWGIYFGQYLLFKKVNKKELLLLIVIIILSFILNEYYIYIRLDIMLAIYFAIFTIYYTVKGVSKYKWQKVLCIMLIIPLAITINLYARKDKLIKDRGLEKVIKEELERYGNQVEITPSNLEKIRSLYIWEKDNVHSLKGIELLRSLKRFQIDTRGIKDLEMLGKLNSLKELKISDGKLDSVLGINNLEYLEELGLYYVKINNEHSLDKFHELKRLSIQGAELVDLSILKGLNNLEELRLSYCEVTKIKGIECLANIKRLELYHTQIKDMDKIKESKSLKVIDLCASEVDDIEELKKLQNPRIIIRKDSMFKMPY